MMGLDQRMWGSNALLTLLQGGPDTNTQEVQLADIPLPQACVASLYFRAEVQTLDVGVSMNTLALTLNLGLGRVTAVRPLVWAGVPSVAAAFDYTLPFVPVKMLLATVSARGHGIGGDAKILVTIEAAPISSFPMQDPLKFGMAKPGEADGLDDSLLEDLEAHSPEEADVLRAVQDSGHDPTDELEQHERGEELHQPRRSRGIPEAMMPPRVRRVVKSLARRLGHPPRVKDLPPWARHELQAHIRSAR